MRLSQRGYKIASMPTIDELVREAATRGFSVIHLDSLLGDQRRALLRHRGHSGPPDDHSLHLLEQPDFLRLVAEIRGRAVVETQGLLGVAVTAIGANYTSEGGDERPRHAPQREGGHFTAGDGVPIAYDVQVDAIGQETWVLHLGYATSAQLDRWSAVKTRICTELSERVDRDRLGYERHALDELWPVVDRAVDLDDFDLDGWAAQRGIPLKPPA